MLVLHDRVHRHHKPTLRIDYATSYRPEPLMQGIVIYNVTVNAGFARLIFCTTTEKTTRATCPDPAGKFEW